MDEDREKMSEGPVKAMAKEVCCKNWVQLFDYLENPSNLQSGLSGRAAVLKVLEGLVENPDFLIQDPNNPNLAYPVKEEHLRNPKYWHNNAFSIQILENAAQVIGGYRPLFQAGIIAGYRMLESAQPRHFQFFRLLSTRNAFRIVSFVNRKMNVTKEPRCISYENEHSKVKLNYRKEFRSRMSIQVCDWNAGIYTGVGKFTGAHDLRVVETECVNRGDDDCVFDLQWKHLNVLRRFLIFCHSVVDPEYIRGRDLDNLLMNDLVMRQEGIIENRTQELKETQAKLIETEKRTLEHRITGGFAHEMRNALSGAQLEFKTILNYQNQGKPSTGMLKESATTLLKNISLLHEEYQIPREKIASLFLPQLKTIAEIADHLAEVHAGVSSDLDRGLSITNQIREYARMSEFKKGEEPVDLVSLLKDYESRYSQDFKRIGISYTVEGLETAVVKADETHMNSIFSNLVLNAKDALEEQDAENKAITISVENTDKPGLKQLMIKVEDNGPGIPAEQIDEIFEPFFSTKPTTGTGLGLGIVKRLVQLYDGKIELESKVGTGTVFKIILAEG